MKIAVDISAVTAGDMDFSPIERLGETVYFDEPTREELFSLAADCNAIIVNKVRVDAALLSACPKIEYVGLFATGYNNIDIAECNRRKVTVCNVPNYSTDAVAQHVFALLLNYAGKISRYTASVAAGDWEKSKTFCYFPWETSELAGKTFGVYGYGNIGKKVARIADAFGMKVIIYTRTLPENCHYEFVDGEEIFRRSDILSLHCPLTEKTEKLIRRDTLKLMKNGATLINTARGGLVDEKEVRAALDGGKLAAYLADVASQEPMKPDNPLKGAPNCYLTPHIAWVPRETRARLIAVAAENLCAYISGNPKNTVGGR